MLLIRLLLLAFKLRHQQGPNRDLANESWVELGWSSRRLREISLLKPIKNESWIWLRWQMQLRNLGNFLFWFPLHIFPDVINCYWRNTEICQMILLINSKEAKELQHYLRQDELTHLTISIYSCSKWVSTIVYDVPIGGVVDKINFGKPALQICHVDTQLCCIHWFLKLQLWRGTNRTILFSMFRFWTVHCGQITFPQREHKVSWSKYANSHNRI